MNKHNLAGFCSICKKPIFRCLITATELDDQDKAVYHESFGIACLKHHGVKKHFNLLIEKANSDE